MVTYASFARLENAIVQQHKQSSKPLPDVGALGNPPKGDFRMPGTLEQAQAHLRSSRELNDLAILGASRGQQTSMLELHFAGKHRDAASNFVHHSCSYQGPGGFYALDGE